MKISLARLDVLIWALVYGGLVVLAVGLALRTSAGGLAVAIGVVGAAGALAGVALVAVRARIVRGRALRAAATDVPPPSTEDPR